MSDRVLTELGAAHDALVRAGKARTGGDLRATLELVDQVVVELKDVQADLRRERDAQESA